MISVSFNNHCVGLLIEFITLIKPMTAAFGMRMCDAVRKVLLVTKIGSVSQPKNCDFFFIDFDSVFCVYVCHGRVNIDNFCICAHACAGR